MKIDRKCERKNSWVVDELFVFIHTFLSNENFFFYHNFSQELLFPVAAEQMSQTKVWLFFPINLSISTSYYLLWFEPRKKIKK